MTLPRVLVVEDGHEYIRNLTRFLDESFEFLRAGDGPTALTLLETANVDAIFLDMKFDRAEHLLGDMGATKQRFAGDVNRARRFLENNQGTYVLAAIRDAGHRHPAVFSYDFDQEPRRFRNLQRRYGPLAYLNDTATPSDIRYTLMLAIEQGSHSQ